MYYGVLPLFNPPKKNGVLPFPIISGELIYITIIQLDLLWSDNKEPDSWSPVNIKKNKNISINW